MRVLLLLTFVLTTMTDCSRQPSRSNDTFNYRIEFSPSFMAPCIMEISESESAGQFKMTIYELKDTILTIGLLDSVKLTKSDFDNFLRGLGDIDLLKAKTNENQGLDGIGVRNFVSKGEQQNEFYFWSPRKGTNEHIIVEAMMELSRKKFKDLKHTEYFESLEQYFDGKGCNLHANAKRRLWLQI